MELMLNDKRFIVLSAEQAEELKRLANKEIFQGTVKFYSDKKGFGFIRTDDKAVFFHISEVLGKKDLKPGKKVEFKIANSPKGEKAVNVRSLND